jgi:LmbE family N-acetylglucosaminyl deacetylase
MDHTSLGDASVDPLFPGTPEMFWAALEAPTWSPPAGPLIVLAPHPDDETLGAGGLIHTWAALHNLPVTIISVTDGESACPEIPDLRAVRRHELELARQDLAAEGIEVVQLGIPDGQVEHHRQELADALRRLTPAGATIIAPFEQDAHPDHNATGRAAWQLAQQREITLAEYPIWAWHKATPAIFNDRRLGRFELTPAAQAAKQRAIRRFESQLRERPGGPIVPPSVLEHFNRPYEMFVLE